MVVHTTAVNNLPYAWTKPQNVLSYVEQDLEHYILDFEPLDPRHKIWNKYEFKFIASMNVIFKGNKYEFNF